MLKSTRTRRIRRKLDWFSSKVRVHFDAPLLREDAERLVTNPITVAQRSFLPLITFFKRERRYRKYQGKKNPVPSTKFRELAYPSNRDGYVFAFYAEQLGIHYEKELNKRGLNDVVIGYRKGSSNIKLACKAFAEIRYRGECTALALDIKGFFDNISHNVLKHSWAYLLGTKILTDDHYAVFKALTTAGKMDRGELLHRLGFRRNAKDSDLPLPLGPITLFRELRTGRPNLSKLVSKYDKKWGIPQGTPLSAMAANISMLEFDTAVNATVNAVSGSYRRYSDDILILCSPDHVAALEAAVEEALKTYTKTLLLNTKKREEARFSLPGPSLVTVASENYPKPLQYLGFTFDGQNARIRAGTLSRYYRRMASSIRRAKLHAEMARAGKITGRNALHKRELLASHSHLGHQSFVSSYGKLSADTMGELGSKAIRRQLSRHQTVLDHRLDDNR